MKRKPRVWKGWALLYEGQGPPSVLFETRQAAWKVGRQGIDHVIRVEIREVLK